MYAPSPALLGALSGTKIPAPNYAGLFFLRQTVLPSSACSFRASRLHFNVFCALYQGKSRAKKLQ
jgi:hypothetical protein